MIEEKTINNKKAPDRARNFVTVIYLDSAPENWKQILEDLCVQCFISPYHNKDIDEGGGIKKPHYHIMMMYDSMKSLKQAKSNFDLISGVGLQVINSTRGYARYLCHLDNPEKEQYSIEDVISLAGADYMNIISLTTDKYQIISEMQDFCEKYNITSFYLLCNYSRKNRTDWYRALCDNSTYYMKEYLKSKKWSEDNGVNEIIDSETGEIIG